MTVLICRQAEVRAHWEQTVAILRKILPESGGHYVPRAKADIFDVELAIGNADVETTLRYDGRTIPIVPFLDMPAGQPSTYWLAWHEGWRSPQVGGNRDKRQFRSSSIAIYAGSPGSNKSQVLRAEWAGAEAVIVRGKPQYTFQGQGAAHPHWHLAGLENNTPGGSEGLAGFEVAETAPVGLAAFADAGGNVGPVQDRTAAFEANTGTHLSSIEPAWASIHLATSARWAQTEWPGPSGPHDTHAIDPATCSEIRSWIVSCVRYLQSELQGQLLRGRR